MCAMQSIGGIQADRILEDSIARELRAVLTSRSPRGWRTFKSRFVSGSRESGKLCLSARLPDQETEHGLPGPGETVGVTFRVGHKKCMSSTTVQAVEPRDDGTLFTIAWPAYLEQLQRRAYERVAPPTGRVVAVRFWREDAQPSTGEKRLVRHAQLEDVSAGGMRIKVSDVTGIELDTLYKCVFAARSAAPSLVLEATLRHQEATECGRASLGFQFIGLETTPDGRSLLDQLARIVRQYQRAHYRGGRRDAHAGRK